jgi:predicted RNase H-like nuclease (RuvC/YqgF family)
MMYRAREIDRLNEIEWTGGVAESRRRDPGPGGWKPKRYQGWVLGTGTQKVQLILG